MRLVKDLSTAAQFCTGKACVYATGSFGRGEASAQSDLDLFIVGGSDVDGKRLLSNLDEICVKANLISATRNNHFQDFSGDGEYLAFYTAADLVKNLGSPQDDSQNTFTARLLLLLESECLIEPAVYHSAVDEVLARYWRDFEGHQLDFAPAFLANDILRLWRTLCVNYEARTQSIPPEKRAKRRLKNYKLKHSRLLTCYSAILLLLAIFRKAGTVSPEDARTMVNLAPIERVKRVATELPQEASVACQSILSAYEEFLQVTAMSEADLISEFLKSAAPDAVGGRDGLERLGNSVSTALDAIGAGNRFYRLLLV